MAKNIPRNRALSLLSDGLLFSAGALVALMLVWTFSAPSPTLSISSTSQTSAAAAAADEPPDPNSYDDPPDRNFYDDLAMSYTIDSPPVKNWDEKRREWLKQHPSLAAGAARRILMVTGSQPTPCKNPIGDHMLLKFFKNKVDYGRRHGIDVFYNNVLLQPRMFSFWAKTASVKAAMLAHPEAEWVWWVDSDAAITDMDFQLPLGRYKAHNMVIHGWPNLIETKRSNGINAGVFLIRNCQWAMDFMHEWAQMGPQAPNYDKWGEIQKQMFKDKVFSESDDQSGLVYLLLNEKEKWGDKIYVENEYYFEGYWVEIVGTFDNITKKYMGIEKGVKRLRRRHAERVSEGYARVWEEHLKDAGYARGSLRRPFITHFTGCQPCSGDHNQMYSQQTCYDAMQKALLFADNQVLRNYGFMHSDLLDSSSVIPIPFNYSA